MNKFLEYSVSYGLLSDQSQVIEEALNSGVDVQKIWMNSELSANPENKNFSALWYAWTKRQNLYPLVSGSISQTLSFEVYDFIAELMKTTEGLVELKKAVSLGLDLTKVKDPTGNNLLHLFFHPLNSAWYNVSTSNMPFESLEFVLAQKVNPNELNHQGKTPLHCVKSFKADKDSGKKSESCLNIKQTFA